MSNDTIELYKSNCSSIFLASLDAQTGLFFNLIGKIPDMFWRVLYRYYKESKILVKFGNEKSSPFCIDEGVKQGGILSPYLFNFFINDLIQECVDLNIDCKIGDHNVCIIAYSDDILLLSQIKSHLDTHL